jgi:hypothetical protein
MVVNFKTRGINRGEHKLTQTPTLIIIIMKDSMNFEATNFELYT